MTWLAWRQFRSQGAAAGSLLAVFAVALIVTHTGHATAYEAVVHCRGTQACDAAQSTFWSQDSQLRHVANAVAIALPALIGAFWGAPLVARELESGTFRMAWTQGVTRRRWITTRLVIGATASAVVSGLFSWVVTWWSSMNDRLQAAPFQQFDSRGVVVVGYSVFAFALGVTIGVVLRRTIPAMAATMLAYFGAHISFSTWIRPHLLTPLHADAPFSLNPSGMIFQGPPSSWALSSDLVTGTGRVLGAYGPNSSLANGFRVQGRHLYFQGVGECHATLASTIGRAGTIPQSVLRACVAEFHLVQVVTFQPASRYWPFQGLETGVFLAAALALAGFSTWWVRRRLT